MGYTDIIAREAETLPPKKQAEVRQTPLELTSVPRTAEEIESFFRSFKVDISGYKFDREEANAR